MKNAPTQYSSESALPLGHYNHDLRLVKGSPWPEDLHRLLFKFPWMGIGPDIHLLNIRELRGIYCFLKNVEVKNG